MIPWLETLVTEAHARLMALPEQHEARTFLTGRGVAAPYWPAYRIGWFPDPGVVTACSAQAWDWLRKYGWSCVVFPLTDPLGQVIGVQFRSPNGKVYREFLAQPSELCPPAFGLHIALPVAFRTGRLILVEGVFDYFAMRPFTEEVVAIMTGAVSLSMRRLIARYVKRVVCLTDMDAPGRRGAYRLAGLPVPDPWRMAEDATRRPPPTPPYHVIIPAYSEHDPSDLLKAGKTAELQRLAAHGRMGL